MAVATSSLITGGTPFTYVIWYCAPVGATIAPMSSSKSGWIFRHTWISPVRIVPRIVPSSGIALGAKPALIAPKTMTVAVRGSTRRVNSPGRSVTIFARAYTTSFVRCGRDECPPEPVTLTSITSPADVIGPTRTPIMPVRIFGSAWIAKILLIRSKTPN